MWIARDAGKEAVMAKGSCYDCVYVWVDPERWLRDLFMGRTLVPMCANHPDWPGELREVTGVPCCNFRPKHVEPEGGVKRIPLSGGRYALVDAADYEWLNQYTWCLNGSGYPVRREGAQAILMHRQIMGAPKGTFIDHIDGNRANNCRANLRFCTQNENMRNQSKRTGASSQFKGVYLFKRTGKWCARICFEGDHIWLGCFAEETEAARAYDRKAVELFGEFARLNFPQEWPQERRAQVRAEAKAAGHSEEPKGRRRRAKAKKTTPRKKARPIAGGKKGSKNGARRKPASR